MLFFRHDITGVFRLIDDLFHPLALCSGRKTVPLNVAGYRFHKLAISDWNQLVGLQICVDTHPILITKTEHLDRQLDIAIELVGSLCTLLGFLVFDCRDQRIKEIFCCFDITLIPEFLPSINFSRILSDNHTTGIV